MPAGNFGLHFARAEASLYGETIGGASDLLKPVQKYQDPEDMQKTPLIQTNPNQVKCVIRKEYLSHWLFKGLSHFEFLIDNKQQWEVHPVNITLEDVREVQKSYQILAISEKIPQIVEHFNTIATQFNLNHVQTQSILFLKNFMAYQLERMSIEGKIGT